jgi:hypothetical protein
MAREALSNNHSNKIKDMKEKIEKKNTYLMITVPRKSMDILL